MHTHLAQHWLTTLETHFALQPVTPDLGDKGLVCWCAGRAGPDVRNGRAGHVVRAWEIQFLIKSIVNG